MSEAQIAASPEMRDRPARVLLFLFFFSLAFMQPPIPLLGFTSVPSDFLFLGLAIAWALLLALGRNRLVWDRAYLAITAYLLALIVSAVAAGVPSFSVVKLLTQLYLLSLPVIICSLVRDEATLRKAVSWWLAGTAIVAGVGIASLAVFAVDPDNVLLEYTSFHFGTLPPGNYPRLSLTFLNANLACNYLTVSLALLLAARHVGIVRQIPFVLLLAAILIAVAATISPGLGGVALALGLWKWLLLREHQPRSAHLFLGTAIMVALLFLGAMAVTPILHPTAPFLIHVPLLETTLAPAGRLMIWMDAARNFMADPLFGRGIGSDAADVFYRSPSGVLQNLTDAHNMFLNIAVQSGVVGLLALLALIAEAVRRTLPLRLHRGGPGVLRLGIGLGLLNGLVYQGLGGSFEDARHLWVGLGLLLASSRLERSSTLGTDAAPAELRR
jgi:O-antigen ligase